MHALEICSGNIGLFLDFRSTSGSVGNIPSRSSLTYENSLLIFLYLTSTFFQSLFISLAFPSLGWSRKYFGISYFFCLRFSFCFLPFIPSPSLFGYSLTPSCLLNLSLFSHMSFSLFFSCLFLSFLLRIFVYFLHLKKKKKFNRFFSLLFTFFIFSFFLLILYELSFFIFYCFIFSHFPFLFLSYFLLFFFLFHLSFFFFI